ncbi:MAG: Mut7-C RNAse domain-containing protein [Chloroflexi bacterium]|nr:Mut7-C RNAse domain-containing protein [Chloroflexota bacterium]
MEPRFIVDSNAGKLARWLRLIGYDTLYYREGPDRDMLATAIAEDRIVLTRDTRIFEQKVITGGRIKAILLEDDSTEKQLKQVTSALNLDLFHHPLSRCLECNAPLAPAAPEEVRDIVPPFVFKKQTRFFRCPACHRVYWEGSHKKAIETRLKKLVGERQSL